MKFKTKLLGAAVATVGSAVLAVLPAYASGPNYGKAWETDLGAKVHGRVQVQASYNDAGRHAHRGYQRFTRQSGPSLDTGRLFTPYASSPYDTNIQWRENWVWDSPIWGDAFVTHYNWGVEYY